MMENMKDIKYPVEFICNIKSKSGPPARGDFGGMLNFEIELNGENADSSKYVYSHKLNRVYLVMMTEMAVRFKWDWNKTFGESLFVRATPIFADNEYQESRVVRCFVHRIANDPSNKNVPSTALNHIMHSLKEGDEISYCGDDDSNNTWLSVATHYPEAPSIGSDCHHHVYRFSCKHSCTSGINRRRIEVLFTLENLDGEILGRRSLGVRVCSCPKRDMIKDEKEFGNQNPSSRKRKLVKPQPGANQYDNITSSAHTINQMFIDALPYDNPAANILKNTVKELAEILKKTKK